MPIALDDRLAQPVWFLISWFWVPLQAMIHLENQPDYIVRVAFTLFPALFCLTILAPAIRSLCGTIVRRTRCDNDHAITHMAYAINVILDLARFSFDVLYEPIPQRSNSPPVTIIGPVLAQSLPKDATHIDTVGLWRETSNPASYHDPNLPLPLPPSATRIWRTRIKRRFKGMKRYWKEVGQQLRLSKGQKQYNGQVVGLDENGATTPIVPLNDRPRRPSILDAPKLASIAVFESPDPIPDLSDQESVTRSDTTSHSPPRTPSLGITFAPLPTVPSIPALPTSTKKAIKMVRLKKAFQRLRGSSTSSTVSQSESSASSWNKRPQ